MTEKLKPCPFCGQDDHGEQRVRIRRYKGNCYRVMCGNCGASGTPMYVQPWHDTKFVAQGKSVNAWNRRADGPENRWIPLEERLPETEGTEGKVLVYTEDEDAFSAEYEPDEGWGFGCWRQHYDPETLACLENEWIPIIGVTHWMPLPEPPKTDGDLPWP